MMEPTRSITLHQVVFLLPQTASAAVSDLLSTKTLLVGSGPQVDWLWDDNNTRLRHDSVMGDQWKLYGHREVTQTDLGCRVHFHYTLVEHGVEVLRALEFLLGRPRMCRKQRQLYFDGPKTQLHVDIRDTGPSTLSVETYDESLRHLTWRDRLVALGLEELQSDEH